MVVSASQRTNGFQRMRDLTSRLHALEWLPMLLIRLLEGLVFADSGRHKFFGDLTGFRNFFVELGIPFPSVMAVVVARIACGGGLCLILGLGTRVAAFAEAVIMANTIWMQLKEVTSFRAFFLLSECLSRGIFVWLAVTGPGKISLDNWLVHPWSGAAQPR